MDVHYSAFISYRHHPDDIRVASEIQRRLETFSIPRSLKKKIKSIDRIFRDKEELPITSDLNDEIDYALKNSDFLIVICSVHTRESVWVQREIEKFLKYHDRDHILTVLASGEPYEVIPDILLHHTVTDPETGETRTVDVEPLSCDWRLSSRRQRLNEELPRLMAALLRCSYDELRQRQRQRKIRRLITVFSLSISFLLCLSAYFIYNSITLHNANLRIQENYEQALRNQSLHLATAARQRLSSGDRLTAIALALAALPDENNQRPYVAEAEAVLTEALGVYSQTNRPAAVGAISTGTTVPIRELRMSADGKYICIRNDLKQTSLWSTETFVKIADLGETALLQDCDLQFNQDNSIFFLNEGTLFCYSPEGTLLWQLPQCLDYALTTDNSQILALCSPESGVEGLSFLDPATGKPVKETMVLGTESTSSFVYLRFCLSNYDPAYPIALRQSLDYNVYAYFLLDTQSGSRIPFTIDAQYPQFFGAEGGKLLVLNTASDVMTGAFGNDRINGPTKCAITCISMTDSATLWTAETTTYSYVTAYQILQIPGKEQLLFTGGSVFQIFDANTGETLSHCDAGGNIIACRAGENQAMAILEDGYRCTFTYDSSSCFRQACMENGITEAAIGDNDTYACLQYWNTQVTLYRFVSPHVLWNTQEKSIYMTSRFVCGDLVVYYASGEGLSLVEMKTRKVLWTVDADYGTNLLGFSRDGSQFFAMKNTSTLITIEVATGKCTETELPNVTVSDFPYVHNHFLLKNDLLHYCLQADGEYYFVRFNPADGTWLHFSMFTEEELPENIFSARPTLLEATDKYAWLWVSTGTVYELDLVEKEATAIASELTKAPAITLKDDGSLVAFTTPEGIVLHTPNNPTDHFLPTTESVGAMHFYGDRILALCHNGYLLQMDLAGQLLSRTELTVDYAFSSSLDDRKAHNSNLVWLFTGDDKLYLNLFGVCNVIDCNNWVALSYVEDFVTYFEDSQQFICDSGKYFYAMPSYATGELLQLAREALGSYQLSDEQKAAYGIR